MIPRKDALELIEGLERASRRTRPFLIFGLILVVAGFISFSAYLYQDRQREISLRHQLETSNGNLKETLNRARDLARLPPSEANSAALRNELGVAADQVASLQRITEQIPAAGPASPLAATRVTPARVAPQPEKAPPPPPATEAAAPALPPRNPPARANYVIRISEPGQRNNAIDFQWSIHSARVNPQPIDGDNTLRCFSVRDCARVDAVTRSVNLRLGVPQLSARRDIGGGGNLPAGTYEIRFAPGPIRSSHYDE